jgi:alpha-D-xyloside xylohydrolase
VALRRPGLIRLRRGRDRRGALVVAALALVTLLPGCGSTTGPDKTVIRVERSPFLISVLSGGKIVVAEDAARLRYKLASNGRVYALTKVISSGDHGERFLVATSEPGRTAEVSVSPARGGYRVEVALRPAGGVRAVYDSFESSAGEHFLGGGERDASVDLAGQIVPVAVNYRCSFAPVPFFASSAGWGLRVASENPAGLAFPGSPGGAGCGSGQDHPACAFPPLVERAEVCVQGAVLDERLYVGSLPNVLADYEADTGRPAVPPPSELELIKWRDGATTPAQVLEQVTRFQQAGIPIGWVELDDPWAPCLGELTFNRTRIPDPRRLIAQVHALGVRFMIWVSPKAVCTSGYPADGLLGPPGATDRALDLRNPRVLEVFQSRLRQLFALGVDGVKADRGDDVVLSGVSAALTNEYPLLYARAVLGVMPKGDAAIFRAGTVGSQSLLPGMWGGDQEEQWTGLRSAIVAAQTAAMSGFSTWGSDIGGYSPAFLTPELFDRWAQFGAVSPVMEVGGDGPNKTPWLLGAAAMGVLGEAAVLHYELYPYLYGLLERGAPVLTPLGYAFPADTHSWASPLEFLVGPDLLAAPVTGPGVTPSVYLPPGSWVDLYTGQTVAGGGPSFTRPTPLDQFPLYARAGSVIPFDLRTQSGSWWGLNDLARPGRAGLLATNGALLDPHGLPAQVQLFVPTSLPPSQVTIGGKLVVSWSFNTGPLPGVVIRLPRRRVEGRIELSSS